MTSLYFDTLIIHNREYDDIALKHTLELFSGYGIKNFIFLADFDFSRNSISLQKEKIKAFKERLSSITIRGVHCFVFNNMMFEKDVTLNKEFSRLYASKKKHSMFLSLSLGSLTDYDYFARDINAMLYTYKSFPLITHFDSVLEYSSDNDYLKLLKNQNIGFGFDLNYLLNPDKINILNELISNKAMVIPIISGNISSYLSVMKDTEFLIERIGNNNYKALCYQIQNCSLKFC